MNSPQTIPKEAADAVEGNYALRGEIARGGMGSILEAEDRKLHRTVAMKVMLMEANAGEDNRERFVREATALAKLAHPNIVPIHDLGRDSSGRPFYTMKLVQGRTLQAILNGILEGDADTVKQFTLAHLLTIFRKVCDALSFAHSKGIIHRDLKPENIMVGEFGEVLVMDWGLAKRLNDENTRPNAETGATVSAPLIGSQVLDVHDQETIVSSSSETMRRDALRRFAAGSDTGMTLEGDVMGTPQYMSPEQAQGRIAEMDARSDIFSLGGILYCILTLRPPVEGKTLEELLHKVVSGGITAPTAFGAAEGKPGIQGEVLDAKKIRPLPHCPNGRVPAALSAVTMKALSLKREARYQNVTSLSADVEAYQNGFATRAENAGAWRQLVLLMKRNKGVSISLLVLLLASIGFVIKVTASERKATQNEKKALDTLAELRATAPTFFNQAKLLTGQENFDEALEKIGIALKLDANNASFHVQRANILQSQERFAEAAVEYEAAAKLNAQEPNAAENATLSRTLAAAKEKDGVLPVQQRTHWRDALVKQGRTAEAIFAGRGLNVDLKKMQPAWQAKIDAWLGKNAPRLSIYASEGYDIDLSNRSLTDISPLRGMPLHSLTLSRNEHLANLRPLADCTLVWLYANGLRDLVDLSPLKGKALIRIDISGSGVRDLSPLAGMPLDDVNIIATAITDLTPLRGMKLKSFHARNAAVRDLEPLRGQPLEHLNVRDTSVTSLDPVGNAPLKSLHITGPLDLASLRQRRLRGLYIGHAVLDHLEVLAEMTELEAIVLPISFTDPSPLRKLPRLRRIDFDEIYHQQPDEQLMDAADFFRRYDSPQVQAVRAALVKAGLKDMPLKNVWFDPAGRIKVYIPDALLADLSPLRGLPINELTLRNTAVSDLEPLRGMPLDYLTITQTKVTSLEPLRGMPLKVLLVGDSVGDVSVLAEIPSLEEILLPRNPKNVERLRGLKKLRYLSTRYVNGNPGHPAQTAEEFWKEYDATKVGGGK